MLLIKNGYLIDPASETEGIRDILIQDGRICRIAEKLEGTGEACEVIDATGLTVLPGLVDVHVHFRDPGFTYKEDIDTGAPPSSSPICLKQVCSFRSADAASSSS